VLQCQAKSGGNDLPVLSNPRHERFAQALFEGEPASAAYTRAGYAANDGNAIRLKGNEKVQARLAELQEATAASIQVSVEGLIAELEAVRRSATSDAEWGSVIKSIEAKGKLSGLFEQKITVRHETREPPPDASAEDIAQWAAANWEGVAELTPGQKREFGVFLHGVLDQISNFLASLKASNAKQINPPQSQPQIIEHERRRLGLTNNRSQR
jgi:hypothetical protein